MFCPRCGYPMNENLNSYCGTYVPQAPIWPEPPQQWHYPQMPAQPQYQWQPTGAEPPKSLPQLENGCPACSAPVRPGMKFCGKCGTAQGAAALPQAHQAAQQAPAPPARPIAPAQQKYEVIDSGTQRVTIIRRKQFVGSVAPYAILIDGEEYATVKNGQTKTFEVPRGKHRIQALSDMSVDNGFGSQRKKSQVEFIRENEGHIAFRVETSGWNADLRLVRAG